MPDWLISLIVLSAFLCFIVSPFGVFTVIGSLILLAFVLLLSVVWGGLGLFVACAAILAVWTAWSAPVTARREALSSK
jgi:hypothetical protein